MRTKTDIFVSACCGNEDCFSLSLLVKRNRGTLRLLHKISSERILDWGRGREWLQECTARIGTGNPPRLKAALNTSVTVSAFSLCMPHLLSPAASSTFPLYLLRSFVV